MINKKYIFLFLVLASLIFLISNNASAKEYASFASFYKESSLTGWIIGGALLVVGVLFVIISGGSGSPVIVGIGSAIGKMMGLSGIAATKAGLALLGGGALATGGFGVIGGTVLLTAIFEGTLLAGDRYLDYIMREINYSEYCELVKDFPTLPPIVNDSGPKEIGEVVDILKEKYKLDNLPSSSENIDALESAIDILDDYMPEEDAFYKIDYDNIIRKEKLRVETLKAILYFMSNNYKSALIHASNAEDYHKDVFDDDGAILDFIYAVSSIATDDITPNTSLSLFRSAIRKEPENKLMPVLYSIYISRIGAKNLTSEQFLTELGETCDLIDDIDIRCLCSIQVATAMLSKIWEAQQVIHTISDNFDSIDSSKFQKCQKIIEEYYKDYGNLINNTYRYISKIKRNEHSSKFIDKAYSSLRKYTQYSDALTILVNDIKEKLMNKQIEEFVEYQRQAVDGDGEAQYHLGLCYLDGIGVKKNESRAIYWLKKSAEQGNADAQYKIGYFYMEGISIEEDVYKGINWINRSAKQGQKIAQNYLGYCYKNGIGVQKDEIKACLWYQKSAEQGYKSAQYNLGNCYFYGHGGVKDKNMARFWYNKAIEQGDKDAEAMIEKIKNF